MSQRLFFLALLALPTHTFSQVNTNSLMREMIDLDRLTRSANPVYTVAQSSSYDRASTVPGTESWFANADWGKYIRVEERDGRKEYVMADLKGPGAVVRIWSANPYGTLRFYFDEESVPRVVAKTRDLLTGKYGVMKPPFGYPALRACNLYFPFPYRQSLKITVDDTDDNGALKMYYHVGYRSYAQGTQIETFDESMIDRKLVVSEVGSRLSPGEVGGGSRITHQLDFAIAPGDSESVNILESDSSAIQLLQLTIERPPLPSSNRWSDPRQIHHILRGLQLLAEFDGEKTVDVPVADFFGSPPSGAAYWTFPMSVESDGTMTCRFVMPFKKATKLTLMNTNGVTVIGKMQLSVRRYDWSDESLYFRAQWSGYRGSTRPFRDFNILDAVGRGNFVGTTYFVANPVGEWWGEGDEKFFVDGENFPSTFGTGTEDYFGYAWSDPTPYDGIAYHSQPNAGSPGNYGLISNNRFHIIDAIPFEKSIRFDMEIWHWKETEATFAATAYWYAAPGSSGPRAIETSLLDVPELGPKAPIAGAIEGEKMKVVSLSGGKTEKQGGFIELSNGQQLWWMDAAVGDTIKLEFAVPEDGTYNVSGTFCHAMDYGIHSITVNGVDCGTYDFYNDGVKWQTLPIGRVALKKGFASIVVKSVGSNDKASPKSNMFGLDYILLNKE